MLLLLFLSSFQKKHTNASNKALGEVQHVTPTNNNLRILISSQNHNNEQILRVFSARLEVIIINALCCFFSYNFCSKRHKLQELFLFVWLQKLSPVCFDHSLPCNFFLFYFIFFCSL